MSDPLMPTIIYLLKDSKYFLSHRKNLALAAFNEGHQIVVACAVSSEEDVTTITNLHFEFVHIPFINDCRGSSSSINSILLIQKLFLRFSNCVIHAITIRAVLLGSFVNLFYKKPFLTLFAGLGSLFRTSSLSMLILRKLFAGIFLTQLLKASRNRIVFMNDEDRELFLTQTNIDRGRTLVIKGSGVDLTKYPIKKYRQQTVPIKVTMTGRILKDKGVREYLLAAKNIQTKNSGIEFQLVGDIDPDNPTSLTRQEIEKAAQESGVDWLGYQKNIPDILLNSDIYCLPTYHEGLPLALLEAAAAGLAIVSTDIAGCRAVVEDGIEGLLVPVRDPIALEKAILRLKNDPQLMRRLGKAARNKVEKVFDVQIVNKKYLNLYQEMYLKKSQ